MQRRWIMAAVLGFGCSSWSAPPAADTEQPPIKSIEESFRCLQARPGFSVELMAAERFVVDPIAIAFGPDGKVWVVEMSDYPQGINGQAGGRVRYLEDTNGDGKLDRSTLFLAGLSYPTSVLPWRRGVLITAAPDLLYAEDRDGDGRADHREVLYTGFTQGNPQHLVNTLAWGLDNWVHLANGDSGGVVKSIKTGQFVDIRGRDLRVRPDTGEIELESGQTQYGRCRDDWGNWFGNNNPRLLWHYALEDRYLRRNPHFAPPSVKVETSVIPGAPPVYPRSRTLARFNDFGMVNHVTSACSPHVYRDVLFGPEFAESVFVCEPVHNLVTRQVLRPNGSTFRSQRAEDEQTSEFLASTDNYFRPTCVTTGLDGALWVADMHRLVIEHPQWIPPDWQARLDLRAGQENGRIYRVYPTSHPPRSPKKLAGLRPTELVAALDSPNGPQRDLAHRLLLEQPDPAVAPLLEELARTSPRPQTRVQSLCVLNGLARLSEDLLRAKLTDEHPGVRRQAVRLCEGRDLQQLGPVLARMTDHTQIEPDPLVRWQLASTLGEWNDSRAHVALSRLGADPTNDRHIIAAVLSSTTEASFRTIAHNMLFGPEVFSDRVESLAQLALAFKDDATLRSVFKTIALQPAPTQGMIKLADLLDLLERRGRSWDKLNKDGGPEWESLLQSASTLIMSAREMVEQTTASPAERSAALRLLGRSAAERSADIDRLAALLAPTVDRDLQSAAARALGRLADPSVVDRLLVGWKSYGPALRDQVLDLLFARAKGTELVLDAIEQKRLSINDLDATRRLRLTWSKDPVVLARSATMLASASSPDRQAVLQQFASVHELTGRPEVGEKIFTKNCAACHRFQDQGHVVGPDLAAVGDKSVAALLTAVLDPNRVVETRYQNYIINRHDGTTAAGVLAAETATSITLRAADGKEQSFLRSEIEELVGTNRSPMPDGLEKQLRPQDLADLFAYIRRPFLKSP